ncbi:TPA: hypothetical protein ACTDMQ_005462, partial [Salmonella enterica subsp. enterica serovar Muenchen]
MTYRTATDAIPKCKNDAALQSWGAGIFSTAVILPEPGIKNNRLSQLQFQHFQRRSASTASRNTPA